MFCIIGEAFADSLGATGYVLIPLEGKNFVKGRFTLHSRVL